MPRTDSAAAGDEAVELSALAGQPLDEWQQLVLRDGMGQIHSGGRWRWSASRIGCWVPRQNGKGAIIEARVLAGLFLLREPLIIWSAHRYNTAQEGFLRLRRLIEQTPELDREVRQFRVAAGEQGVELRSGVRLRFLARSRTSGRGWGAPCVIWDEGQELTAEQVAAMLPTISAQTDPQTWIFGTPPTDPNAWCYGLREEGQAGRRRLVWLDWGAADDVLDDPQWWSDRDMWHATNPGLGMRITEATVEDECGSAGLGSEFPHERLGAWRPHQDVAGRVIPPELWQRLCDPNAERPDEVAFALQVNRERTRSAIAYAGRRSDGALQVGLIDWRPGTGWVLGRLMELNQRWRPVATAVAARSESLLLDLEREAGLTVPTDPDSPLRGDLAVPTAADAATAYGLLVDASRADPPQLRHGDDAPVNSALAEVGSRPVAGGMTWDDKGSGEPGPLQAITWAVWAFETRAHLIDDTNYETLESVL